MGRTVVFHNPRCSKSRGVVEILRGRGVDFEIVEYLKTPPDRRQLERIVGLLPGPAAELVRKDSHFDELGLRADAYQSPDEVVDLLLKHPRLMQRPVVVRGERAVIARPPEKVAELLEPSS
jgi:arsenate reductase